MFRFTKRLLCVLALVALTVAPAQAATILEDFESYTPTSSWLPTYPDTDWGYGANSPLEISATGGYGGTQCLAMTSPAWPQQAYWLQAPDWSATPNFTFSYDFILGAGDSAIYSTNGIVTSGGQFPAVIGTGAKTYGGGNLYLLTNGDVITYLPGEAISARDVWYTAEMEYDYTTKQVRGRFGPVGGVMNDWTDWLGMYDSYKNDALEYTIFQQGNGGGTFFDNVSLIFPPGDLNGDGYIDEADLQMLKNDWGSTVNLAADFNGDGIIGLPDAEIIRKNWLQNPGGSASVPEPGVLVFLTIGSLALVVLRRRCRI